MPPSTAASTAATARSLRVFDLVVVGALALVAAVVALLAVLGHPAGAPRAAASRPARVAREHSASTLRALALMRTWDGRRAEAYAEGIPGAVRRLYVPGSPAGIADVRLVSRYRARGLRVTGMRMQVLSVVVLREAPDRWRLAVTDRLAHAEARPLPGGHGPSVHGPRVPLPRDAPTRHVVELVRTGDGWRMSTVRDAPAIS